MGDDSLKNHSNSGENSCTKWSSESVNVEFENDFDLAEKEILANTSCSSSRRCRKTKFTPYVFLF